MQTKAVSRAPRTVVPTLSLEGSFVVQLTRNSRPGIGGCQGRVEHISSGSWAYFVDVDELLAFVDRTMAALPPGE